VRVVLKASESPIRRERADLSYTERKQFPSRGGRCDIGILWTARCTEHAGLRPEKICRSNLYRAGIVRASTLANTNGQISREARSVLR